MTKRRSLDEESFKETRINPSGQLLHLNHRIHQRFLK